MAVETSLNRKVYSGNGVTTVFPTTFQFLANTDLKVIQKVVLTGVETLKTITTDYTISGGNGEVGSVTMLVAPPTGTVLTIYNDPEIVQEFDLVEGDISPAEGKERAWDRLTYIAQRLADRMDRALRLSEGFTAAFDLTLPTLLEAGRALIINETNNGFDLGPTADEVADAQQYAEDASDSADAAAASAGAASTSASNAAQSAMDAAAAVQDALDNSPVITTPTLLGGLFQGCRVDDYLDIDQEATPATPAANRLRLFAKTNKKLATVNDAGLVVEVGSGGGGGGGRNYADDNSDAEIDASGFTGYADAAAVPVDLTGGSPTATLTRTTSNPLRGAGSFLLTAGALGDGFAKTITPDRADISRGSMLNCQFEFEPSATIAEGDYTFWVYDVANSALIQPSGYKIPSCGAIAAKHVFSFQLPTNGTTFRVGFHQAVASPGGNLKFDTLSFGPTPLVYGSADFDWRPQTLVAANFLSFGTVTSIEAEVKRVGDTLFYRGKATAGTVTAGAIEIQLPNGWRHAYSVDTVVPGNFGSDYTGANLAGMVPLCPSAVTNAFYVVYNNSRSFFNGLSVNSAMGNNAVFTWNAQIKIAGWGGNVVMSSDADTRVVACRYELAAGSTLNNAGAVIAFGVKIFDTHSAFSAGVFTAPVPGIYRVSAHLTTVAFASGAIGRGITGTLRKNSSTHLVLDRNFVQTTTSVNRTLSGSADVSLNAGETLDLFFSSDDAATTSSSQNECHISVERISGPATIAASEGISSRGTNVAGTSIPDNTDTLIPMVISAGETHAGSLSTAGVFTAPAPGRYAVRAMVTFQDSMGIGSIVDAIIKKNGSTVVANGRIATFSATSNYYTAVAIDEVRLLQGETIGFYAKQNSGTGRTLTTLVGGNVFSVTRVGNY